MAKQPHQPLVVDERGQLRFQPNQVVLYLLRHSGMRLNDLECMGFTPEDWAQFYELIGFSAEGMQYVPGLPVELVVEAVNQHLQLKVEHGKLQATNL